MSFELKDAVVVIIGTLGGLTASIIHTKMTQPKADPLADLKRMLREQMDTPEQLRQIQEERELRKKTELADLYRRLRQADRNRKPVYEEWSLCS